MNKLYIKNSNKAFSLVELLVVIAVIGILAAIMSISYSLVAKRAAGESIKADLLNASSILAKFKADRGVYPKTLQCDIPDSSTNKCIKKSSDDIEFKYNVNTATTPDTYGLTAIKKNDSDLSYRTTTGSEPIPCPVGYIIVPGSKTYNTSSFCVMKYEAKNDGNDKPVSKPEDQPWSDIPQIDAGGMMGAINRSKSTCTGCHLMTEAEWMTVAQNVLKVNLNWSEGVVGSGYIRNGNNDSIPGTGSPASTDDDGYHGTGNTELDENYLGDMSMSLFDTNPNHCTAIDGDHQLRTLTLSNGEVIWDLAGNVSEWTDAQIAENKPGIAANNNPDPELRLIWNDYPDVTIKASLSVDIYPDGLGIPSAGTWDYIANGIGTLASDTGDNTLVGFGRGGDYDDGGLDGVLALRLDHPVDSHTQNMGFRVSR